VALGHRVLIFVLLFSRIAPSSVSELPKPTGLDRSAGQTTGRETPRKRDARVSRGKEGASQSMARIVPRGAHVHL